MHMRRFGLLLVFVFSSCLIVFSDVSIKASALTLPSGGHFMTAADTLSFIGNEIEVTYYNGTGYVTTTAYYDRTVSANVFEASENPVGFVAGSSVPWIQYSFTPTGVDRSPAYITFSLTPRYSIFDTEYLYTCLALSSAMSAPSNSTYNSPASNWYVAGSVLNFHNTSQSDTNSGYKSFLNFGTAVSSSTRIFTYVPIVHSQQNTFSAYCQDVAFYGNDRDSSGKYYFMVMCPYVSTGSSGASGTFVATTGGSSGGDINVDVNIDMEETNSWLENIFDGISGIGSTISGLFMPDEQDMTDFYNDLVDLLDDSFSGYQDSTDILDDVKDTISNADPVSTVTFPQISVPHTNFSIGPYTVSLAPDSNLLDAVRLAIDLIATCAVINLIRKKIDEIIHGKVVVESEEVEMS